MELPKNEATFNIDLAGEVTGKRYEGMFTVRCALSMGQRHMLELEKSRLLGNYTAPTDELIGISVILATLRTKIIEGPEWWKQSAGGSSVMDDNVLLELYNKIIDAEIEWKKAIKEKANPPATESAPASRSSK